MKQNHINDSVPQSHQPHLKGSVVTYPIRCSTHRACPSWQNVLVDRKVCPVHDVGDPNSNLSYSKYSLVQGRGKSWKSHEGPWPRMSHRCRGRGQHSCACSRLQAGLLPLMPDGWLLPALLLLLEWERCAVDCQCWPTDKLKLTYWLVLLSRGWTMTVYLKDLKKSGWRAMGHGKLWRLWDTKQKKWVSFMNKI